MCIDNYLAPYMTTATHAQFVSSIRSLVSDWERLKAKLEHRSTIDRQEGFEFTAKAQDCAVSALNGCIAGVKDLLPKEEA